MAFRGLLKSSDPHSVCEHQTANRGLDDQSAQQSNYLGALVGHSANPRRTHGRERQCCAPTRRRPARAFVTDRLRSMRYLRFRHNNTGCSMPMPLELMQNRLSFRQNWSAEFFFIEEPPNSAAAHLKTQYRETLEWHQPILHRFRCKFFEWTQFLYNRDQSIHCCSHCIIGCRFGR